MNVSFPIMILFHCPRCVCVCVSGVLEFYVYACSLSMSFCVFVRACACNVHDSNASKTSIENDLSSLIQPTWNNGQTSCYGAHRSITLCKCVVFYYIFMLNKLNKTTVQQQQHSRCNAMSSIFFSHKGQRYFISYI